MPVKLYKPTSPGRRGSSVLSFQELSKKGPEKSLLAPVKRSGGRNNHGNMSVRHRGGGAKRKYRIVDFKRAKHGIPARVASIEYDPNRSARIALLNYVDGEKRYIIAPDGLRVDDVLQSGPDADIRVGNALPLSAIPTGTTIHAIELQPGRGAAMARSAGTSAQLLAKEGDYAVLRLPSGEQRRVHIRCLATVGQVGNLEHDLISLGKAGRARHLGRRPTVRGVVMNPVDHPHGGGEGKSPIGLPGPKTKWGRPALGVRTRGKKITDKLILRRRK